MLAQNNDGTIWLEARSRTQNHWHFEKAGDDSVVRHTKRRIAFTRQCSSTRMRKQYTERLQAHRFDHAHNRILSQRKGTEKDICLFCLPLSITHELHTQHVLCFVYSYAVHLTYVGCWPGLNVAFTHLKNISFNTSQTPWKL